MENTRICVDSAPFDVASEYNWLAQSADDGAVVTFTGKVRNHNQGEGICALELEHYPGMTQRVLNEIVTMARSRWPLHRISVIHRVGKMYPNEGIVFIGVSSAHRSVSFSAAEFIMDLLKTQAPFWKRETTLHGEHWVEANEKDNIAVQRWQLKS